MKTRAFYSFAALLVVASLLLSSCALAATPEPTPTNTPLPPTATPKPTVTFTPTVTPKPTITLTPTITPNATTTQRVADFTAKVQEYQKAGYISTADGTYTSIRNYSESMAMINWGQRYLTDLFPTHFVVKSDLKLNSASRAADPSGCGFTFRMKDDDFYVIYMATDGYVYFNGYTQNKGKYFGRASYGKGTQEILATLTLLAEDSKFTVLVNDTLVKTFYGYDGKLSTGELGFYLVSGTNKSYGTQCKFNNTELWTIKK